jgi:hypothetical protein
MGMGVSYGGPIAERPWGWRLWRAVLRGETGQITIEAHDKRHGIALDLGRIVAASSPVAADSAARIALVGGAITTQQLAEVGRRLTAAPDRDEIELVCEVGQLSILQSEALRQRVITQRAARTFGLDDGTWTQEDKVRLPMVRGISVDVRSVVYLGARMYMTDERMANDLRRLGTHFTLRPDAVDELSLFGFTEDERPVIRALRGGASLAELEARLREVDPRMLQSIVYALATCEALTCVTVAHTPTPATVLFRRREPTPDRPPALARTMSPQAQPVVTHAAPQLAPAVGRAPTPQDMPVVSRTKSPTLPITARKLVNTTPPVTVARVKTGRAPTAPLTSRTGTRPDAPPVAGRVASQSIPVDPSRTPQLAREAYARGERALKIDKLDEAIDALAEAVQLQPTDVDYAAALAWATFCSASDKQAAATAARRILDRAVYKSAQPATALFWLARMERIVGRDHQALRHFLEVQQLQPSNETVAGEIRVLKARIARDSKR